MLGNYKMFVNSESESKEAQWLFCLLGGSDGSCDRFGIVCLSEGKVYTDRVEFFEDYDDCEEITLSKLRDLVVLHRNDVNDWNCVDPEFKEQKLYLCSDKTLYVFDDVTNNWKVSSKNGVNLVLNRLIMKGDQSLNNLISSSSEGLITGVDALRAFADGKEVDANNIDFGYWFDARNLNVTDFFDDIHTFRLKPSTIKLEIEIPKPFEPKVGDYFYVICPTSFTGYTEVFAENEENLECFTKLGAWRSSEEIKKVVEALSSLKNSIKGVDNV